jgi:hypothetical protein
MQNAYGLNAIDARKLSFYTPKVLLILDTLLLQIMVQMFLIGNLFQPKNTPYPSLENRMEIYNKESVALSIKAIEKCIDGKIEKEKITHLITVSCTGMSAWFGFIVNGRIRTTVNYTKNKHQFHGLLCCHTCVKNGTTNC